MKDDLVPLKRVLDEIGVSRASLWRATRSGIAGFPEPTIVRRRVYWRADELPALEAALDHYAGRCMFERRMQERAAEARRAKVFAEARRDCSSRKRRRSDQPRETQRDLFD